MDLLRNREDFRINIGKLINAGSYGFVAEYLEESSEKKVIKILDPRYVECVFHTAQPQTHSTLLSKGALAAGREWDWAQKVGYTKHPHLMPLMSGPGKLCLDDRSISFLVMPYLSTIEDLDIDSNGEQQVVPILSDCCSGLQVLHRELEYVGERKNGMDALVHCDIKPNNIFYSYSGKIPSFMIGDYSIAQRVEDLKKTPIWIDSSDNPYCAPGNLERTSDIYSLGWVLFYWLKGKKHPTMREVSAKRNGTLSMPSLA